MVAQPERSLARPRLDKGLPARERSLEDHGVVPTQAQPKRAYAKPVRQQTKKKARIPTALQLPLLVIVAIAAGFGAQSYAFGEIAVVIYGIVAVACAIPSRTTFILGALSTVATTLALILQGNVSLSQNFATDTFLLLVVGVISLGRELKKEGGRVYSRRTIQ